MEATGTTQTRNKQFQPRDPQRSGESGGWPSALSAVPSLIDLVSPAQLAHGAGTVGEGGGRARILGRASRGVEDGVGQVAEYNRSGGLGASRVRRSVHSVYGVADA